MDVFKVGEAVIGQNFIVSTELNGMEAEIIGGLTMRRGFDAVTLEFAETMCYEVMWATGAVSLQEPWYLRRRKPPTTGEESIIAMFRTTPKREGVSA